MLPTIHTGGLAYRIAEDLAARHTVLAIARVRDGDGASTVSLSAPPVLSDARITALSKPGGFLVLAGDPDVALPNPALPTAVDFEFSEPGFRQVSGSAVLPGNATLPVILPDIVLRRWPRTLEGRVVSAATGAPIAGAAIELAPSPTVAGQHLVVLGQPLSEDVPAGTAVQGVSLTPVGGAMPVKTVLATSAAGATCLELDDRRDLAAGQVLRLGPVDRTSLCRIRFVAPVPAPTQPGFVLATPLTATARRGDPAEAFTALPAGPVALTVGLALAGEALLVTGTPPAGDELLVGPVATAALYTRAAPSDADGYYRRIGLARLPRFHITISATGFAAATRAFIPATRATRIDWRLAP